MRKSFGYFLLALLLLACRDKIICPAFQSTYILDEPTRNAYYSYVWKLDQETRTQYLASAYGQTDSLSAGGNSASSTLRYYDYVEDIIQPREEVIRSKYGIVKYEPMWLKNYKLKTAPMENVLGPEPEMVEPKVIDTGEFLASDFTDSLASDSTMFVARDSMAVAQKAEVVASTKPAKKQVKYLYRYDPDSLNNVEQEYYNKYFGKLLVDYSQQNKNAQSKVSQDTQSAGGGTSQAVSDSTVTRGKFKLPFKKKEKSTDLPQEEATEQEEGSEEEGGF